MAQIVYRANLGSKSFPLLPSNQGNTVIIPGADQAYTRWGTPGERELDVNIAHAYYMQNFLPTTEGFASINYVPNFNSFGGQFMDDSPYALGVGDMRPYQYIRAIQGSVQFAVIESTNGLFYYSSGPSSVFTLAAGRTVNNTVFQAAENTTYANTAGATYGFFQDVVTPPNNTFNIWNGSAWVDAVPLGLALANITGIVSSNGYNIAFGGLSLSWSSTTNPIDFVPSLVTGAGGATVQELGGPIRFACPSAFGFILYTDINCVSATYTGNARFPFKFEEIKGAGGFISQRLIVSSDNLGYQIAITKAGLQRLSTKTSEAFLPELADFIFGNYGEEWNYLTSTFVQLTNLHNTRNPAGRLRLLDSRYLVYSYFSGIADTTFTQVYDYALVYDMQLERWGKLKRNHIDIYSLQPSGNRTEAHIDLYRSWNMLSKAGEGNRLIAGGALYGPVNYNNASIQPIIFLGRYQYVRSRHLILDQVKFSGIVDATNQATVSAAQLSVSSLPTLDSGAEQVLVAGYLKTANTQKKNIAYSFSLDALSHAIVIKGHMDLTSLELTFHLGGKV